MKPYDYRDHIVWHRKFLAHIKPYWLLMAAKRTVKRLLGKPIRLADWPRTRRYG